MTIFGIKGSKLSREILETVVSSQATIFKNMLARVEGGEVINPKPNPIHIREILSIYAHVLDSKKYSVSKVVNRIIGLPCSIGGEHILPTPLVIEFGLGATHFDYKDVVDGDDTIAEVMVCRPKGNASHNRATAPWNDMMNVMRDLTKKRMDQEDAIIYLETNYDLFPGGLITCPGWKEGVAPEARVHGCGNISYVKELYHNYQCPECTRAAKKFRMKGKVAAGTAIRTHVLINRFKIKK